MSDSLADSERRSSEPPLAMADRLAVDAKGYVWRVWDDEDYWSMAPTNPDNSPIPQPVTYFFPAQLTPHEAKCIRIALAVGDPAGVDLPDEDLERAKAKLRAIERGGEHS